MPQSDELLLRLIYQEENKTALEDAKKRLDSLTDAEKQLIKANAELASNAKKVEDAEKQRIKTNTELANSAKKVSESFTGVVRAGRGLSELGRAFDIAGQIFGNENLKKIGEFSRGIGEVTMAYGNLKRTIGELNQSGPGQILAGVGAGVGGALIGSQIYDATIGKLQGTDTATILSQIQQLMAAGFNVDTLKVQAQQAVISAQNAEKFTALQTGLKQIGKSRLDLAQEMGIYTGPRDEAGMRAALKQVEEFLKTAPEWKPAAPGEKEQINYKLQAQVIAAGLREELQRLDNEAAQKKAVEDKKAADALQKTIVQASLSGTYKTLGTIGQLQGNIGSLNDRRAQMASIYSMQLVNIEKEAQQKRIQAATSLSADLASIEKQYYAERQKVAASFGIETSRMEQDHQREMRRMQEDHTGRLRKLAESRDALAIEDENDSYRTQRDRAEEDYQVNAARRNEDFALQLRDMEAAFRDQRDARQAQYRDQLNQINQQAQDQRNVATTQWQAMLQTIVTQTVEAIKQLNAAFASLQTTSPTTPAPVMHAHAWGGYQNYTGAAYMHAGEFVLNAQTARAMEVVTGQRLSQSSVLGAMGGAQVNLSVPITINGAQSEPEVYRTIVHEEIVKVFNAAVH